MGVSSVRSRAIHGLVIFTGSLFLGCGASSPVAPLKVVLLTVRVLTRGDEEPIANASVSVNNLPRVSTDARGVAGIAVVPGDALRVDVTADGYIGFGADGAIANAETWTFYLSRDGGTDR